MSTHHYPVLPQPGVTILATITASNQHILPAHPTTASYHRIPPPHPTSTSNRCTHNTISHPFYLKTYPPITMSKSSRKTYKQTHSRRRVKPTIKAPTRLTNPQVNQIAHDLYATLPAPSEAWNIGMVRSALRARYREFWEWQAGPMRHVSREVLRRMRGFEMEVEEEEEESDGEEGTEDGKSDGEEEGFEGMGHEDEECDGKEGIEEEDDVDMGNSMEDIYDVANKDEINIDASNKDEEYISKHQDIQRDEWAELYSDEDLCEANEKILASMSEWNGLLGHKC